MKRLGAWVWTGLVTAAALAGACGGDTSGSNAVAIDAGPDVFTTDATPTADAGPPDAAADATVDGS